MVYLRENEVLKKLKTAYSQKWDSNKTIRCPRLKTLANIINEFIDGYTATVRNSYRTLQAHAQEDTALMEQLVLLLC